VRQQDHSREERCVQKMVLFPRSNVVLAVFKAAWQKISTEYAQTLPYGSTPHSYSLVIFTLQGSFDREVNQSVLIGRLLNC